VGESGTGGLPGEGPQGEGSQIGEARVEGDSQEGGVHASASQVGE